MVLILSNTDDHATNDVIDWIRYYKISFVRISVNDLIRYHKVVLNNNEFDIVFSINNVLYKLSDFKAFWYRRSHYNIFYNKIFGKGNLANKINSHLELETNEIHKLFMSYIEERSINKYADNFTNKLKNLKTASSLGIKIPDTIITDNKQEVLDFLKIHKTVITKNFSQGVFIFDKSKSFSSSTKIVTDTIANDLSNQFYYSLFQEGIDKLFELRIFFLRGKFYASAIFSQNDEKTSVDFRNYNWEKPNRTPPFQLPKKIENKLLQLMNIIGFNSGSIDMLISKQNEYVFLEVNPIGQFSQVSIPCNYYLEREIVRELIKIKNGTK